MKQGITKRVPSEAHKQACKEALDKLLEHCGGYKSSIAKRIDKSPQSVNMWFIRGFVPESAALDIEKIEEFKKAGFTFETLRPDLA